MEESASIHEFTSVNMNLIGSFTPQDAELEFELEWHKKELN